jgi:hypothetical protein
LAEDVVRFLDLSFLFGGDVVLFGEFRASLGCWFGGRCARGGLLALGRLRYVSVGVVDVREGFAHHYG